MAPKDDQRRPPEDEYALYEALHAEMVRESEGLLEEILEQEGALLALDEFARRLNVGSESVLADFDSGRIIGIAPKDGADLHFPGWQIHNGKLLPGLADVLKVLWEKDAEPLSCVIFFVYESDDPDLSGAPPVELLRRGRTTPVIDAAHRLWQMGT